jgi:outer membrane receptor protein involved in Fe transport
MHVLSTAPAVSSLRPAPIRRRLAVALLAALPAFAAAAPEPEPDPDATTTLDDVVVTATKQQRTAFETAASVDIVDGEAAASRHLDTLAEVAQQLPNVYFTAFTHGNPSLTIRGLGFSDDESDSLSTSVLVDGIPTYGLVLGRLFDIDQIEVLRGPQSTLYGQNSMGGLVAVRTRDPGSVFGGSATLDIGSDARRSAVAALDLPASERTAIRVAVGTEHADGYIDNTTLGRDDTGGWHSGFGRVKLVHRDDAGGEWRVGLHHLRTRGGNDFFAPEALARRHESAANERGRNDVEYTLLSGEYTRVLDSGVRLTSTLGATTSTWNYWMPRSVLRAVSGFDTKNRQYSAELRLAHDVGHWDWLAGAYVSKQRREAPYLYDMSPYFLSGTGADVDGTTAALFGEAGWKFADAWRIAGALRIEHDRRRMDWDLRMAGLVDSDGDGMPDLPFTSNAALRDLKTNDTVALPRLALEYAPDATHFGWLTLARGYKASGFNVYATDVASARTPYDPEYGNHVELGWRVRGADDAWDIAATAFYTRLRDQQVVVIDAGGQSMTSNAGRSHSQGVELAATLRPSRTLALRAQAGFVEAQYDEYRKGNVDYAGKQFPNTPRHSVGASIDWRPHESWNATLSATRLGRSTLYPNSATVNPAYTLVDAQATYRHGGWTFGVYGNNLTDATYFTRALSNAIVVAGMPRTFGVRVGTEF